MLCTFGSQKYSIKEELKGVKMLSGHRAKNNNRILSVRGTFHKVKACPDIGLFVLLLAYAIAAVSWLYIECDMMYEMRRRKPQAYTFLQTQGIFNLPHYIGIV